MASSIPLSSLLTELLTPLPSTLTTSSPFIPEQLLNSINTSITNNIKLKITSSVLRKAGDQLRALEEEDDNSDVEADADEEAGALVEGEGEGNERDVEDDDEWVRGLKRKWDGEGDDAVVKRYEKKVKRVKELQKELKKKRAQKEHYSHILSLTEKITEASIRKSTISDASASGTVLVPALKELSELLPILADNMVDAEVLTKRERRRAKQCGDDGRKKLEVVAGVHAGRALVEMLKNR